MMQMNRRQFFVLTGALGWAGLARAQSAGAFSFAAVNDLHLTDEASTAALGKAVDAINAREDVAFTAVLGDVSSSALPTELALVKSALDRLRKPYYAVPGNHDRAPKRKGHVEDLFEKTFGPANWVRDHGDWTLIGIDSCTGTASEVTLSVGRLLWLKQHLEKIPKTRPIALFLHHPLNPHAVAYRIKNAEDVLALFAQHNLKLSASGHFHGNQVEEQNGILYTTTACCTSTRGNHDGTTAKGYRLFHCRDGQVTTEFVEVAF